MILYNSSSTRLKLSKMPLEGLWVRLHRRNLSWCLTAGICGTAHVIGKLWTKELQFVGNILRINKP